jgi:ribosomal protein S18 acetylase RimI-like enzyme
MSGDDVRFLVGTSTAEDIRAHLLACDAQFRPRLSERVDIDAYSRKLAERALTEEAWHGSSLVGLVAAYVAANGESCYITNVSVVAAFTGRGIATMLIRNLVAHPACLDVATIELEVSSQSVEAIRLYTSLGFRPVEECAGRVLMQRLREPGDAPAPDGPNT